MGEQKNGVVEIRIGGIQRWGPFQNGARQGGVW